MAARRLIIVMAVLLIVSTAIAVVVPNPNNRNDEQAPATTGVTGPTGETATTGLDEAEPNLSKTVVREIRQGRSVGEVSVAPGDRLILSVKTAEAGDVEIDGLGLTDTATTYEPARFDILLPPSSATYRVTSVNDQKLIARIVVGADEPKAKAETPKKSGQSG